MQGVLTGGCCSRTDHALLSLMARDALAVMDHWGLAPARVLAQPRAMLLLSNPQTKTSHQVLMAHWWIAQWHFLWFLYNPPTTSITRSDSKFLCPKWKHCIYLFIFGLATTWTRQTCFWSNQNRKHFQMKAEPGNFQPAVLLSCEQLQRSL